MIYSAKVVEVTSDDVVVDVKELGLESLRVEYILIPGQLPSETGLLNILPKKGDDVMIFLEGGELHRAVLLPAKVRIKDLKEDSLKLKTPTDTILMDSAGIKIGSESASQPLVLGYQLLSYLAKIYSYLQVVGSIIGVPPSPMFVSPPNKSLLSSRHKTC